MRLVVEHLTSYRYDQPMRYVTQSHRLTPSVFAGQRVIEWSVTVEGATIGAAFTDGAGDRITTMTLPGPVEGLVVRVAGVVETVDLAGVLQGHAETISPRVYLRTTHATGISRALRQFGERALSGAGAGDLDRAHALAAAVTKAIAYRPGSTHAHTTAAEALEQGEGVCQDHAHVLIAIARAAGLPARYVVGYLHATNGDPAMIEASHAWAEIHVDGLGWVGFDPSNGCCPDERYIRLGSGLDAATAAPIRGVSRGLGTEALQVAVSVSAADAQ